MAQYGTAGRLLRNPMFNPGAGVGQAAQAAGSGIMSAMPALSTLGDALADALSGTLVTAGSGIGSGIGETIGGFLGGPGGAAAGGGIGGTVGGAAAVPLTKALGRLGTGALGHTLAGAGGVLSGNPTPGRDIGLMAQGMAGSMPDNPGMGTDFRMPGKVEFKWERFDDDSRPIGGPGESASMTPSVASPASMDFTDAEGAEAGRTPFNYNPPTAGGASRAKLALMNAKKASPMARIDRAFEDAMGDNARALYDSGMSMDKNGSFGWDSSTAKKTPPAFRTPTVKPARTPPKPKMDWNLAGSELTGGNFDKPEGLQFPDDDVNDWLKPKHPSLPRYPDVSMTGGRKRAWGG